jgi:cytochrome P450
MVTTEKALVMSDEPPTAAARRRDRPRRARDSAAGPRSLKAAPALPERTMAEASSADTTPFGEGVTEAAHPREGRLPPEATHACGPDLLAWMQQGLDEHGDIFRASLYGGRVYVTSRPEHAEHVLRRSYWKYRKGIAIKRVQMLLGNGLMVSEGGLWKRQRRMIQPGFQHRAVGRFLQVIDEANLAARRRWLAAADAGAPLNVTREVSQLILEIALRTIFGRDYERIADAFSLVSDTRERDLRFAQDFRALGSQILALRDARSGARPEHRGEDDDFLDLLLGARDRETGEVMTDAQLVNEVLTLIVAGHETTAGTLAWTWYLLSQDEAAADRLAEEVGGRLEPLTTDALARPGYAARVLDETMRLYPPGWLLTRRALEDDFIGDYFVPRGTEIYIPLYVLQRRPELWDRPDQFDPDRFLTPPPANAFLPFSAGPRNCIGEHLAKLEMLVHLVRLGGALKMRYEPPGPVEYELGVNLRNRCDFVMSPERRLP